MHHLPLQIFEGLISEQVMQELYSDWAGLEDEKLQFSKGLAVIFVDRKTVERKVEEKTEFYVTFNLLTQLSSCS